MPTVDDDVDVDDLIDNRYRIKKFLGEGATSRVYVADDTALDKVVALKILRTSAANRGRAFLRFEQEARVMIAISHPNVCRVFGFGRLPDSRPYLVMEFLQGRTLHGLLRKTRPLEERTALAIIQQLLAGLMASHALGIVHRDVKPSNVFLAKRDYGIGLVKLLDFGLAKAPPKQAVVVTRPGFAFGTPGYAAPEVLVGGAATSRADVWSVGVMLFELLAGVRPFRDPGAQETAFEVTCGPTRNLREYAPDVSDEIIRLIDAALVRNPDQRIQSAEEFSRRLSYITDDLGPPSTMTMTTESIPVPSLVSDSTLPKIERTPLHSIAVEAIDSPDSTTSTTTTGHPIPIFRR